MQFIFSSSFSAIVAGYVKRLSWAEKMVQKLRALAPAQNTGWSPSTPGQLPTMCKFSSRGPAPSSALSAHQAYTWCTNKHSGEPLVNIHSRRLREESDFFFLKDLAKLDSLFFFFLHMSLDLYNQTILPVIYCFYVICHLICHTDYFAVVDHNVRYLKNL